MSMLTLSFISQSFGDYDVFTGISATIPNDGKIGLVGPNGIGKTTLLRIIAGEASPSTGSVHTSKGTRIGYLHQEAMAAFGERTNTVQEEMLLVFAELKAQEARMQELQDAMASGNAPDDIMAQYSRTMDAYEAAGGYEYEVRIDQILQGLGFGRDARDTPLTNLSGGQKTRALLARLLLEQPDILILDEPTNHLDVETIEWLEGMLRLWDGAFLIVSHDRYFLDKVVNRIWEMGPSGMEVYRGNYTHYLTQREERWAQRESEFNTIKEKFLSELDYVKRNIARDSTTNMAKGRLKRLVREVKMVEIGGLSDMMTKNWSQLDLDSLSSSSWSVMDTESHIKGLRSPVTRPPSLTMRLNTKLRSGELVLRSDPLTIGYPDTTLFVTQPLDLRRKECAALIGPNGTGKTTLLRTVLEQIEPLTGELRLGASLRLGYFAQAHEKLDPNKSVLDELLDYQHMDIADARNHLARYLFRNEDVYKPIHMLSGGERGRLALSLLALDQANFLLMDEPTNHLDIPTQEVLQDALEHFDGTILMVSHDRYLISRLATQIWSLENGKMRVFKGTYEQYMEAKAAETEAKRAVAAVQRAERRNSQQGNRAEINEARKRAKAIAEMETKVEALEERLAEISEKLQAASDAQDMEKIHKLSEAYASTSDELDAAMEAWAEMAE